MDDIRDKVLGSTKIYPPLERRYLGRTHHFITNITHRSNYYISYFGHTNALEKTYWRFAHCQYLTKIRFNSNTTKEAIESIPNILCCKQPLNKPFSNNKNAATSLQLLYFQSEKQDSSPRFA